MKTFLKPAEVVKLFSFSELPENAKEKVIEKYFSYRDYPWYYENKESLETFFNVFGVKVTGFSYGGGSRPFIDIEQYDNFDIAALTGQRLATWLINNILPQFAKGKYYSKGRKSRYSRIQFIYNEFTGFYMDYVVSKPLLDFIQKPDKSNIDELLQKCGQAWLSTADEDHDQYFSESYISEWFEENGTLFDESGREIEPQQDWKEVTETIAF